MNQQNARNWILLLVIPVAYAVVCRVVFNLDIIKDFTKVMSLTFFISLPFGVGMLTILLSGTQKVKKLSYRIFMPWIPVFVFFLLTLLFSLEGWACWLMILPIFLIFASLGGLTAGYFKLKKYKNEQRLNISLVFLLPFVLSAFEKILPALPTQYEAYTYIDIHATKENIWNHVIRVKEIKQENDHGTLSNMLGLPRPVKAELNYAGIGGSRKAVFTKGLVFEETVKEYENERSMHFSIKANPFDIPSTTMDKHIVIGGDYFDVLDGTYRLEQTSKDICRLHLYSHFELKTTFNGYAGLWARWIMKDIQNNILRIIKSRSEDQPPPGMRTHQHI